MHKGGAGGWSPTHVAQLLKNMRWSAHLGTKTPIKCPLGWQNTLYCPLGWLKQDKLPSLVAKTHTEVPSWEPKCALKCPSFRPCPSKNLCTPLWAVNSTKLHWNTYPYTEMTVMQVTSRFCMTPAGCCDSSQQRATSLGGHDVAPLLTHRVLWKPTYSWEGDESLYYHSGGRAQLVGFLNQHIQSHLRMQRINKKHGCCNSL